MNVKLKNFINENIDLINKNSKESWEEIYQKLYTQVYIVGEFTELMLEANIDPAKVLGYIPYLYLYESNITSYKIPDNVKNIDYSAFGYCFNLVNIEIPATVLEISNSAFLYCESLKEINFKGTKKQAIKLGIGSKAKTKWREASSIEKIICSDGVIEL